MHVTKGRGVQLLIPDLGTRWGWVVSVKPRPRFIPGKGPPVPTGQEAGWASDMVWTQKLEEKSFASAGIEPRSPVVQSVARHYTDCATPAPLGLSYLYIFIYHAVQAYRNNIYNCLCEIFMASVSAGFVQQVTPYLSQLRYNGSLATWWVVYKAAYCFWWTCHFSD
jgi:hypothetical protein